jgi:hypothetical protein
MRFAIIINFLKYIDELIELTIILIFYRKNPSIIPSIII